MDESECVATYFHSGITDENMYENEWNLEVISGKI